MPHKPGTELLNLALVSLINGNSLFVLKPILLTLSKGRLLVSLTGLGTLSLVRFIVVISTSSKPLGISNSPSKTPIRETLNLCTKPLSIYP